MRHPWIESSGVEWDWRSIYYPPPPGGTDVASSAAAPAQADDEGAPSHEACRLDVESRVLGSAEVLRDAVRLAGNQQADFVRAAVYWIAAEAAREMRISTTAEPLKEIATHWDCPVNVEFAEHLAALSTQLLKGAALVGVLRATAWYLSQVENSAFRSSMLINARREADRVGMISGRADLIADDAHAHLSLAERVKPGYEDLQATLARQGTLFLGAAWAMSLTEPWNPFTRHRLEHELDHHSTMLDRAMSVEEPLQKAFAVTVQTVREAHAEARESYEEALKKAGPGGDIAVYFYTRAAASPPVVLQDMDPVIRQFLAIEIDARRVV